ncbi:MAG TPA: chromate efflux transporter [Dehalococcoidia bacterium]|jgi:chromate transporter|nr:chromate efflux transporter [Dehalococcoidia bacterium]
MARQALEPQTVPENERGSAWEVLWVAARLGMTSFGGPVAHLGYFHEEYVRRRRWLSEEAYAEVVALSQALPGPASSQTGMAVGLLRAGLPGALCAWLGFTIPSALLMIAFAYGVGEVGSVEAADWLHGLKLAAVAIVALAVWSMARALSPDRERGTIAIVAAILMLSWQAAGVQVLVIVLGGIAGWMLYSRASLPIPDVAFDSRVGRNLAATAWVAFFALLIGLPLAASLFDSQALNLFDSFYRTGSLVFGGGHVVLPLLEREVVAPGWVTQDDFLAGYGAAQAVPGPLFTFSAYLGAVMQPSPTGVTGGVIALVAIFLPSFLLIIGGLPLWRWLRLNPALQAALRGVNAAVVGLLLAALYDPVWLSAVRDAADLSIALAAFGLLVLWKAPPWSMVLFCALAAEVVSAV